jgi:hypothetical protein
MDESFPICSSCVFYFGAHSTIFGEGWSCQKDNPYCSDIADNDWALEHGEDIIFCEDFIFGKPTSVILG